MLRRGEAQLTGVRAGSAPRSGKGFCAPLTGERRPQPGPGPAAPPPLSRTWGRQRGGGAALPLGASAGSRAGLGRATAVGAAPAPAPRSSGESGAEGAALRARPRPAPGPPRHLRGGGRGAAPGTFGRGPAPGARRRQSAPAARPRPTPFAQAAPFAQRAVRRRPPVLGSPMWPDRENGGGGGGSRLVIGIILGRRRGGGRRRRLREPEGRRGGGERRRERRGALAGGGRRRLPGTALWLETEAAAQSAERGAGPAAGGAPLPRRRPGRLLLFLLLLAGVPRDAAAPLPARAAALQPRQPGCLPQPLRRAPGAAAGGEPGGDGPRRRAEDGAVPRREVRGAGGWRGGQGSVPAGAGWQRRRRGCSRGRWSGRAPAPRSSLAAGRWRMRGRRELSAGARRAELARLPAGHLVRGWGSGTAGPGCPVGRSCQRCGAARERSRGGRPVWLRAAFVFDFCRSPERLWSVSSGRWRGRGRMCQQPLGLGASERGAGAGLRAAAERLPWVLPRRCPRCPSTLLQNWVIDFFYFYFRLPSPLPRTSPKSDSNLQLRDNAELIYFSKRRKDFEA